MRFYTILNSSTSAVHINFFCVNTSDRWLVNTNVRVVKYELTINYYWYTSEIKFLKNLGEFIS